MKKLTLLILTILSLSFIYSCREDGELGGNDSQFGYSIERDNNFIEKGVGENNSFKYNVISNYDFSSLPMNFKFTTNLNGVLRLNGQVLTANQDYQLASKNNIFEYTGNVSGTHDVIITSKNSKGFTVEQKFQFPYGTSEFTHTYVGGTGNIYQGDETYYNMKVVPSAGQPNNGYEIRFNSFNGNIKLNGVAAQVGQYYPLANIDSFSVVIASNQVGQIALDYTIKNGTVSKDYNIQQTIIKRQITVESMNINSDNVPPNTPMSLIGVIKKSPTTTNTTVQYKTWISSASNNNMSGITNTNNVYIPYALGANGSFSYNFNAVVVGTYIYNIQFKDEYGNESDVKSFTVEVANSIVINSSSVQLNFSSSSGLMTRYRGAILKVNADVNGISKINKVVFNISYQYSGNVKTATYTYDYPSLPTNVNIDLTTPNESTFVGAYTLSPLNNVTNATYEVHVYDNQGNIKTYSGVASKGLI